MKKAALPRIGMRMIKTAVAVMLSYGVFALFGLEYREELGGMLGHMGPLYACIACIVCTQSSLGQTFRQGVSRFIGVAVGGVLGAATLLLGGALESPWVLAPVLAVICLAGLWFCLLIKRPAACPMACIVPCVILLTGVTGADRYYYAAARILETVAGVGVAFLVNAALPDHRRESAEEGPEANGSEAGKHHKKTVRHRRSGGTLQVAPDPERHACRAGTGLRVPVPAGTAGDVRRWLECAKFAGYAGFNATMPHKEELLPLMDELDEDARLIGAVNTVCLRDGKAYGYNTDGAGFLRALADENITVEGRRVLVLGAGGAARAVCLKLAQAGADVTVCNRTVDKAAALCARMPERLHPAGFDRDTLHRAAAECALLVNCTSLGMAGAGGRFEDLSFLDALAPETPVCDLIYAPAETELLRQARERGHRTMNGMGLLVHQAVLALERFTGVPIDAAAMRARLIPVLSEKT